MKGEKFAAMPKQPRAYSEFNRADLDARQKLYQLLAEQIWNPEQLHENGRKSETI